MNCREFEQAWQDRLDRRETSFEAGEPEAHAARCPACGGREVGFELLLRSLQHWGPAPMPRPDLAGRVLAELDRQPTPILPMASRPRLAPGWLAAAAASVLAAGVGLWAALRPARGPEGAAPRVAVSLAPRSEPDVGPSLARVTSATLDLAERASAPAARLGLLVLSSATPSSEAPDPAEPDADATGEVLRTVGDRVSSGVRPISGSARRAFGFLLGPAGEPSRPPDSTRPKRRGA